VVRIILPDGTWKCQGIDEISRFALMLATLGSICAREVLAVGNGGG